MRRSFASCVLLLLCCFANAQHRVQFILSPSAADKTVYLAGSFNNWNPGDNAFRFSGDTLNVSLLTGTHSFKLTLGSWQTVETDADGGDVANRMLELTADTTITLLLPAFKTATGAKPRQHTACKHVQLFDSAMYVPQLNRYRKITIHLPHDYHLSSKRYPVLYVHDGQNAFDNARAAFGEWKMDESLDSIYEASGWSPIVVAIDNGDKRLTEYNTNSHSRFGKAEGNAYLSFIVNTLKPSIDSAFRTRPGRKSTWMAGSSMGGVISTAALILHSKSIGGAGIFSPAYWTSQDMFRQMADTRFYKVTYAYVYAGGREDSSMVPLARKMFTLLQGKPKVKSELLIDEQGQHNEPTWARYFPGFLHYMRKHSK